MGAVAKATHLLRRAPVALKFMSPAVLALQGAVERFVNEGVAASQIDSDHVVKVFDVGRMPTGAPYLVMEFLDGQRPRAAPGARGRRGSSIPRAVHFILQILRALQTAHAAGIIHRDMKPSNCFVVEQGRRARLRQARRLRHQQGPHRRRRGQGPRPTSRAPTAPSGTPLYMSPEQARSPRDVDPRSRPLLGRRHPLRAAHRAHAVHLGDRRVHRDPLQDLHHRPRAAAVAAARRAPGARGRRHRALARDLDARFASAAEMAEALAPFADERSANGGVAPARRRAGAACAAGAARRAR